MLRGGGGVAVAGVRRGRPEVARAPRLRVLRVALLERLRRQVAAARRLVVALLRRLEAGGARHAPLGRCPLVGQRPNPVVGAASALVRAQMLAQRARVGVSLGAAAVGARVRLLFGFDWKRLEDLEE